MFDSYTGCRDHAADSAAHGVRDGRGKKRQGVFPKEDGPHEQLRYVIRYHLVVLGRPRQDLLARPAPDAARHAPEFRFHDLRRLDAGRHVAA